jgi:hypothetical protein
MVQWLQARNGPTPIQRKRETGSKNSELKNSWTWWERDLNIIIIVFVKVLLKYFLISKTDT